MGVLSYSRIAKARKAEKHPPHKIKKEGRVRTFLKVQWLRFHTANAGGIRKPRSHMESGMDHPPPKFFFNKLKGKRET